VERLKSASLGQAPALPEEIGPGWKGLPRDVNTSVNYKIHKLQIKMFYNNCPFCHFEKEK
jgi:hypothetical protein